MSQLAVVKHIDHLMIEVKADGETFSRFVSLLTEVLGLPVAFPLTPLVREAQLVFNSLGLFAGNVYFELFQLVATLPELSLPVPLPQTARLYGVAFEPQQEEMTKSLRELHARQIPYLPPLIMHGGQDEMSVNYWTMVFLLQYPHTDRRKGENLVPLAMPPDVSNSTRMMPDTLSDFALRGDLTHVQGIRQEQFLASLQSVFSRGLFFLNQFSPASYEQVRVLRPQQLRLRERFAANPLGMFGLQEIVVGATDVAEAGKSMQRLFAPREPEGEQAEVWRFADGPALRLVADSEDRLVTLVFQVQSLEQARNVLREHGLLDMKRDNPAHRTLMLDTTALLGLDIRLTE